MRRKIITFALLSVFSTVAYATNYAVYLYVDQASTAPAHLESDLIASVTSQFQGTLLPSLVPGQYIFTLKAEGPAPMPPDAFSNACAYCFANGLDFERASDLNIIKYDQSVDSSSGSCSSAYGNIQADIKARWGQIFTDTQTAKIQ